MLSEIEELTLLNFVETDDANGDIRFATTYQTEFAGITYPSVAGSLLTQADIALDHSASGVGTLLPGSYMYKTLIHEIGHALGLKHPGNYDAAGSGAPAPYLPPSQDSTIYTIESYNNNTSRFLDISPNVFPFPKTLMTFDIAALQYLYGVNDQANVPDDSYSFDAGAMYAIWDAGGFDWLDASAEVACVTLDLTQGGISYVGRVGTESLGTGLAPRYAIAYDTIIEGAIGGAADDILIGNAVSNTLLGLAGNDTIDAGDGHDFLDGGRGADQINAGDGDDILEGEAGDDVLDGGLGHDQANYSGAYANYTLTFSGRQVTVTDNVGSEGTDTLTNIELLSFADQTVTVTVVNAVPILAVPPAPTFTDTAADDTFSPVSGTLAGSDIDGDTLAYGIDGGTDNGTTVSKVGSYGTLTVTKTTGAYVFAPNDSAIEALSATASETYTVTVSDGFLSASQLFVVNFFGVAEAGTPVPSSPTSRYTVLETGPNLIDFYVPGNPNPLGGQNIIFKGNSGIDTVYIGPAQGLAFDFTQAGLGNDLLYLSGEWADYSQRSYSGSIISLTRTDGNGSETIKAISGDTIVFGDGSLSVTGILNYLKGQSSEPIPDGDGTPAWPLPTPTGADNTLRAVVLDAEGETLALNRPGVDMVVKGGSGVDSVLVMPGSTVDATQLGLGQDRIHLQGVAGDYAGSVAGSIVTLTREVAGLTESAKFLGGSATAYDSILFGDGTAKSVDLLNFHKNLTTSLTLDNSLTSISLLGLVQLQP